MSFWDGTRWVSDVPATTGPPPRRRGRRFLGAAAEATLVTALIFGLIAGSTLAAKGGNARGSDSSSLALVLLDSTDGVAHHGQRVTFDVSSTADKPYVNVRCYQDGAFVYDAWAGFYAGAWFGQEFTLSSMSWVSGQADCTARLVVWGKNGRERTLGTLGFHVAA